MCNCEYYNNHKIIGIGPNIPKGQHIIERHNKIESLLPINVSDLLNRRLLIFRSLKHKHKNKSSFYSYRDFSYDIYHKYIPIECPKQHIFSFEKDKYEYCIPHEDMVDGYVYFVVDGDYIKIGYSRQKMNQRLSQLQVGNPRELTMYTTIKCDTPEKVEIYLHDKFRHVHTRGEWFRSTCEEVDNIVNKIKYDLVGNLSSSLQVSS